MLRKALKASMLRVSEDVSGSIRGERYANLQGQELEG
jgi:hypothetical protein